MDSLGMAAGFDPPPVEALDHLDVAAVRQPDGTVRVEVTDSRCGLRLIRLSAGDAAQLGGLLVVRSAHARCPAELGGWQSGTCEAE